MRQQNSNVKPCKGSRAAADSSSSHDKPCSAISSSLRTAHRGQSSRSCDTNSKAMERGNTTPNSAPATSQARLSGRGSRSNFEVHRPAASNCDLGPAKLDSGITIVSRPKPLSNDFPRPNRSQTILQVAVYRKQLQLQQNRSTDLTHCVPQQQRH